MERIEDGDRAFLVGDKVSRDEGKGLMDKVIDVNVSVFDGREEEFADVFRLCALKETPKDLMSSVEFHQFPLCVVILCFCFASRSAEKL